MRRRGEKENERRGTGNGRGVECRFVTVEVWSKGTQERAVIVVNGREQLVTE